MKAAWYHTQSVHVHVVLVHQVLVATSFYKLLQSKCHGISSQVYCWQEVKDAWST